MSNFLVGGAYRYEWGAYIEQRFKKRLARWRERNGIILLMEKLETDQCKYVYIYENSVSLRT
jgi:hypothetical protein